MRLGLSATAAAASLYGAVVLFGLGPASPLALGSEAKRDVTVVRVPPHDLPVSGPAQRRPQASPGPARLRTATRGPLHAAPSRATPAAGLKGTHAQPANPPTPPRPAAAPTVKVPVASASIPEAPLPPTTTLPTLPTLPPPPTVTLPTVTVPPLPQLQPPPLPELPAPPPLP